MRPRRDVSGRLHHFGIEVGALVVLVLALHVAGAGFELLVVPLGQLIQRLRPPRRVQIRILQYIESLHLTFDSGAAVTLQCPSERDAACCVSHSTLVIHSHRHHSVVQPAACASGPAPAAAGTSRSSFSPRTAPSASSQPHNMSICVID